MIRAFIQTAPERVASVEAETVRDLFDILAPALKEPDSVAVIRFPDDATFMEAGAKRGKLEQRAKESATMIAGSQVPVWTQAFMSTDGPGWRVIYARAAVQMQQQPQAAPGRRIIG